MVTNVSPSITASPLFTLILVMVPEVSASILFCIFMASRMTTVSPAFTLSPTFTLISLIVPGRGATTGLPAAAVGAELPARHEDDIFACRQVFQNAVGHQVSGNDGNAFFSESEIPKNRLRTFDLLHGIVGQAYPDGITDALI